MIKVLFVCLGNICRSPLAEAIFNHECKKRNLAHFLADSAGTAAYHIGKQPDSRSIEVAQKNGIDIEHRARQYRMEDAEEFDFIFAMDTSNFEDIIGTTGRTPENLFLLRDYNSPNFQNNRNVPDPYYGGIDGFNDIFEIMSDAIKNFLDSQST